jgi:hypothetical protein
MNTDARSEGAERPAMPAGLRGLWGEACEWVGWLLGMFDRNALRTTGVKRETGARLSVWLMNIEGAIRRLVLAAALALAPSAPRKAPACAAARVQPAAASARRARFCVFRLCGAGEAHAGASPSAQPRSYGHIHFPSDPLLSLGAAQTGVSRHARATSGLHHRNPLDRWGRLSRQDPDWRPSEEDLSLRDAPQSSSRHAQGAPRHPRAPHDPAALPESLLDWRRHHDEWERRVPAPELAARLEALAYVMAHPEAAIARAARRLHAARTPILPLARNAATMPGPPRRAAHIATAGHTLAFTGRCHDALVSLDTS